MSNDETGRAALAVRVALMFAAASLIWIEVRAAGDALFGPEYSRGGHIGRAGLISLTALPAVAIMRAGVDRRPWETLGLGPLREHWRYFVFGAAGWLIPAALAAALVLGLGLTQAALLTSTGELLLTAASLVPLVLLYEALPEELIFRGYFYRNLAEAMPRWTAVVVQAALFALWGLTNGGPVALDRTAVFFLAGIAFGLLRAATGSVWAPIGAHVAFQTVAQLFGDVGGQFALSEPAALTAGAFGAVPMAAIIWIIESRFSERVDWTEPEGPVRGAAEHGG